MQAIHTKAALTTLLLCLPVVAGAAHTTFLVRNGVLCDQSATLCIRCSLTHNNLSNRFRLLGRVQRTTVPGTLIVRLRGRTTAGHRAQADLSVDVRGRYSEIVDKSMIPDAPSQTEWELERLIFIPDTE